MNKSINLKCKCGTHILLGTEKQYPCRVICGKCNKLMYENSKETVSLNDGYEENEILGINFFSDEFEKDVKSTGLGEENSGISFLAEDLEKKSKREELGISFFAEDLEREANLEENKKIKEDKYIANFKIEKTVGKGGAGIVYLAEDENGEKVAIKLLKELDGKNVLDYFLRESQMLLSLNHPCIVKLKKVGNHENSPYIAMEYIDGKNLEDVINDTGALPVKQGLILILKILDALFYASKFKIIHRDIKPSNIMIENKTNTPKLIDLGLAKSLGSAYELTMTGKMMGTPYYMPPEQFKDAKRVDYRADVYAVGATLYHILVGKPPFASCRGRINLLFAKTERLPEKKNLPDSVYKIIAKSMAINQEERFAHCGIMQQYIKKLLGVK